ncbi:hypothetical protein EDI_175960 [Entamoeba dispar SAW760]|uniref:Uncharacterized protein n=1 Tax=Entamoeba dispar (strain ATCC PRA-260 / SAW760) TaxID=370354 RepID=B0ELJ5_ENTDS|nr:uncharacterized protein EDI_175960 [Entamoeba dispar SAW760]EDR24597.1 hypothetical protein EDI_175960 [Entamoeba dispar SAW760]|eukprot:EDR24597.1 hypothetical protein EDI_175960 [Entamoeba dispar SAW760]
MGIESEDKAEYQKLEYISVNRLINYFDDLDELKEVCSNFVECFKKEETTPYDHKNYDELIEKELDLVYLIHNLSEGMIHEYKDVEETYKRRAFEREFDKQMITNEQLTKKPKIPKED